MVKQKEIPCIHIGYAKSGSTTLQKQLFSRHPQINYLGTFPRGNIGIDSDYLDENSVYLADENLREFYRNLVMLDRSEYQQAQNQELFAKHIDNYFTRPGLPLFSNERFTSVFFAYPDLHEKANRIKTIFPDARILCVIRNQLDLIVSQYRDHPFDPRNLAKGQPVSIDDWIEIAFSTEDLTFLDTLKYHKVIEIYKYLFGKENIKILSLEELAKSPDSFARQLSEFLGIDADVCLSLLKDKHENRGVSKTYNHYRIWKRRLELSIRHLGPIPDIIKKYYFNLDHLISERIKTGKKAGYLMSESWIQELSIYYRKSNRILMNEYQLNLEDYGYPL